MKTMVVDWTENGYGETVDRLIREVEEAHFTVKRLENLRVSALEHLKTLRGTWNNGGERRTNLTIADTGKALSEYDLRRILSCTSAEPPTRAPWRRVVKYTTCSGTMKLVCGHIAAKRPGATHPKRTRCTTCLPLEVRLAVTKTNWKVKTPNSLLHNAAYRNISRFLKNQNTRRGKS